MLQIKIAEDFYDAPGGRYRIHGKYSAEEFRETLLLPKYLEAVSKGESLFIILDGIYGMTAPFIDEAFGCLYREFGRRFIETVEFCGDYDFVKDVIEGIFN